MTETTTTDWVQEFIAQRGLDGDQFTEAAMAAVAAWPDPSWINLCPNDATVYHILVVPQANIWSSPGEYRHWDDGDVMVSLTNSFGASYPWRPRPTFEFDGLKWTGGASISDDHTARIMAAFLDTLYQGLVLAGITS